MSADEKDFDSRVPHHTISFSVRIVVSVFCVTSLQWKGDQPVECGEANDKSNQPHRVRRDRARVEDANQIFGLRICVAFVIVGDPIRFDCFGRIEVDVFRAVLSQREEFADDVDRLMEKRAQNIEPMVAATVRRPFCAARWLQVVRQDVFALGSVDQQNAQDARIEWRNGE